MFLINNNSWYVKDINDKGKGVFAAQKIKSGTVISDYLGKIIRTAKYDLEQDKQGLYLMYFSDQASIYPDLSIPGPHLINHSCNPNCWIYVHKNHTLFFAIRDITPHEELTISYLLSPLDDTCNPCPHVCKCLNPNCKGTMHLSKRKYAMWQKFQNSQNKKTRKAKVIFDEDLRPLPAYPPLVPFDPIYNLMANLVTL